MRGFIPSILTDNAMIGWGGTGGAYPCVFRYTGGRYRLVTDSWKATPLDAAPVWNLLGPAGVNDYTSSGELDDPTNRFTFHRRSGQLRQRIGAANTIGAIIRGEPGNIHFAPIQIYTSLFHSIRAQQFRLSQPGL